MHLAKVKNTLSRNVTHRLARLFHADRFPIIAAWIIRFTAASKSAPSSSFIYVESFKITRDNINLPSRDVRNTESMSVNKSAMQILPRPLPFASFAEIHVVHSALADNFSELTYDSFAITRSSTEGRAKEFSRSKEFPSRDR